MNSLRISHLSTQLLRRADYSFTTQLSRVRRSPADAAAFFHISRQRAQGPRPGRYGTAKPPAEHLKDDKSEASTSTSTSDSETAKEEPKPTAPENLFAQPPAAEECKALPPPKTIHSPVTFPPMTDFAGTVDSGKPASSLDRVLDVQSPNRPDEEKPPHLQAPKYVHHFDTWSIVKDLEKGGFSQEQTVTIMKAVRGLLGDSMGLARKALVSKSNEENEMYLFKAACSELKTEIQNNRKAEAEILRTQRSQLQHEVDILGQNMTQDLASLKDELKGLFDDRKMIVRVGQKQIESKIQELNYKITVALNSDARGLVEGMRWILTRRAGMAIAISTLMVLATLNYSRYMIQAQEAERIKLEKDIEASEEVISSVKKGSTHGLAEEALLAPDGVSGG